MKLSSLLTALLLTLLVLPALAQSNGLTPAQLLSLAIHQQNVQKITELLEQYPGLLNQVDAKTGATPLEQAMAQKVNPRVLDAIFSANFDENQRTASGTPLQAAIASGFGEGVKRLIAAGADVDALSSNGETPLQLTVGSAMSGNSNALPIAQALVAAGADVNKRNSRGAPPLVTVIGLATVNDSLAASFASMLVKAGAEVNPTVEIEGKKASLSKMMSNYKIPKTQQALRQGR